MKFIKSLHSYFLIQRRQREIDNILQKNDESRKIENETLKNSNVNILKNTYNQISVCERQIYHKQKKIKLIDSEHQIWEEYEIVNAFEHANNSKEAIETLKNKNDVQEIGLRG